ncbi:MAG: hypothetical protein PHH54_04680 [Candidatus Nanoarchaeia archaeon]|nr:hypothetical protein [Candidatus Nanoarchaeia archaeon]MDD5741252.1 hypothetical protein [Candidatus Nanoarchaeia archaeon]
MDKIRIENWNLNNPFGTENLLVREARERDIGTGIEVSGFRSIQEIFRYAMNVAPVLNSIPSNFSLSPIINPSNLSYKLMRRN